MRLIKNLKEKINKTEEETRSFEATSARALSDEALEHVSGGIIQPMPSDILPDMK